MRLLKGENWPLSTPKKVTQVEPAASPLSAAESSETRLQKKGESYDRQPGHDCSLRRHAPEEHVECRSVQQIDAIELRAPRAEECCALAALLASTAALGIIPSGSWK